MPRWLLLGVGPSLFAVHSAFPDGWASSRKMVAWLVEPLAENPTMAAPEGARDVMGSAPRGDTKVWSPDRGRESV